MLPVNVPPTTAADLTPNLLPSIAAALARLDVRPPFALAVSGGSDSMAMMLLAAEWADLVGAARSSIHVLTVNHRLRPEAAEEAQFVTQQAAQLGFNHATLEWTHAASGSRLQERAREARYELLGNWCRAHGIDRLLTAHTEDDQLETVGMRLMKGSGPAGLGGMSEERSLPSGVRLIRPLLGVSRAGLQTYLQARNRTWVSDPSNNDARFERVRMRAVLAETETSALQSVASEGQAARSALDAAVDDLLRDVMVPNPHGWATIDTRGLFAAPNAVLTHSLKRLCRHYGGAVYAPPLDAIGRLAHKLRGGAFGAATLGGALIVEKKSKLLIGREARNQLPLDIKADEVGIWDGRLKVRANGALRVEAMGTARLAGLAPETRAALSRLIPPVFQPSAPALVRPVAAPALVWGWVGGEKAGEISALHPAPFASGLAPV